MLHSYCPRDDNFSRITSTIFWDDFKHPSTLEWTNPSPPAIRRGFSLRTTQPGLFGKAWTTWNFENTCRKVKRGGLARTQSPWSQIWSCLFRNRNTTKLLSEVTQIIHETFLSDFRPMWQVIFHFTKKHSLFRAICGEILFKNVPQMSLDTLVDPLPHSCVIRWPSLECHVLIECPLRCTLYSLHRMWYSCIRWNKL